MYFNFCVTNSYYYYFKLSPIGTSYIQYLNTNDDAKVSNVHT